VPLGLIEAVSVYSRRHTIRCGLAVVKQRLLRVSTRARSLSPRSLRRSWSTRRTGPRAR